MGILDEDLAEDGAGAGESERSGDREFRAGELGYRLQVSWTWDTGGRKIQGSFDGWMCIMRALAPAT